jgi:hypothetical protein
MLNHNTGLFSHHIDAGKVWMFAAPVVAVTQHPTNPNIWGLKNLGTTKWVSTSAEGALRDVESGKSVSLTIGTRINFGKVEGEITR